MLYIRSRLYFIRKIALRVIDQIQTDRCSFGLSFMVYENGYHLLSGHSYKVEDRKKKILKYIDEYLDHKIHAKQINLLTQMAGAPAHLDESRSLEAEDTAIVPFEEVRRIVIDYVNV